MVPLEAFLMSSAQACRLGLSACWAGTQLESLSATGLSWAWATPAPNTRAAAIAAAVRGKVKQCLRMVSSSLWLDENKLLLITRPARGVISFCPGPAAGGRTG